MNPKKMIETIRDQARPMQERMFCLVVLVGTVGLLFGVAGGAIAGEKMLNVLVLFGTVFLVDVIAAVSLHMHRIQIGAAWIGALIIYFVLPFNFLTSSGIYGGAPIWLLFGVVYICLVVQGWIRYFYLATAFIVDSLCYYIAYFHPKLMVKQTTSVAYIDSILTLIIVSLLTCGMILFQNVIYRSENEIAKKQKKEIEELNRTQNNFFSSMSHEIRTPINTIIGLNEMILREDVSDEVASDARSIQGASKMLLTLINDILDMSKMEAGKMDIVSSRYDVGAMLSDIVNMIWVRAKQKGLEFHIDVDSAIPAMLYGDEIRIKQVLINVLNNAVKYTQEGSVTLSIQCRKEDDDQVLVTYSIADTGMGIKKENIPYLFSAFKRVDEDKNRYIEGTGLGLSIVKQLVELMGGDISVNSVYTKGSTFVVTIPQKLVNDEQLGELDLENRYTLNQREHYKQSFEAPKAHLLIVDDNETNLMVAEKLLRETKVQIDTATSGRECLKKTFEVKYDVIFMDHLMPEMDGIECLHAIHGQVGGLNLQTPVVALTANAGGENQALYRREGFEGYLLKPVTGVQLERELLRHLPTELVKLTSEEGNTGTLESPVFAHKNKLPIRISTDSVSDLPEAMVLKYQISVIPYCVKTSGGEFWDGLEAETDGLLEYIKQEGKEVESNAPEIEDYINFFAEQLTGAQYVVHISMAKNSSQGYANALEAARSFDNVFVINSGHLSSGMGLMVITAAQLAESGMTTENIISALEKLRDNIHTSFIVDDTRYLVRSGRISSKISAICEGLMLHPVIILKNSGMTVGRICAGTREHVRRRYIRSALEVTGRIDQRILFITYAGLSIEELRWVEEEVAKKVSFERVIYQKASPAISINCGPGCFGLLFMNK